MRGANWSWNFLPSTGNIIERVLNTEAVSIMHLHGHKGKKERYV